MCLLLREVAWTGQPGWEAEPEARLGSAVSGVPAPDNAEAASI